MPPLTVRASVWRRASDVARYSRLDAQAMSRLEELSVADNELTVVPDVRGLESLWAMELR